MVRAAPLDTRALVDATGAMDCRVRWAPGAIWGFLARRGLVDRPGLQVRLVPVGRRAPRVLGALARLAPPVPPAPAVCRARRARLGRRACQCAVLQVPRGHRDPLACRVPRGPQDPLALQACQVFPVPWATGTATTNNK